MNGNIATASVIEIEGLRKSFRQNHVLRGINLHVNKGENAVVMGRSGVGKSLLIKIICGLLSQDSGLVNVLGKDVENLTKKELIHFRRKVGFSFQGSGLYDSMTVGENVAFSAAAKLQR